MFVPEYRFTATEHDTERPWIVVSTERRTIELPDGTDFITWSRDRWPPSPRTVHLDPWQLTPKWPGGAGPTKRS
jgi:hypothetical protein